MAKIKLEDISSILKNENWKVISSTYKSLETEMEFECPEGHRVFTNWKRLRSKRECPVCKQNTYIASSNITIAKPKGITRILALDQATKITGYSVFDDGQLIKFGTFKAPEGDEIKRLLAIKQWLLSMITNLKPDCIAIEGIQFQEQSGQNKMGITVFQTLAHL